MLTLNEKLISWTAKLSTILTFVVIWIWLGVGALLTIKAIGEFARPHLPFLDQLAVDTVRAAGHSGEMAKAKSEIIIPVERIAAQIYLMRGEQVMLDADLAELYQVETGALIRAMKRNQDRFPEEFAFQLSKEEFEDLRSQIGISSWGGRRYAPYAFTEQGVAMLSGVLRSKRAAQVNVAIMRTFVRLRRMLATNEELARKVAQHDQEIGILFEHIQGLLEPAEPPKKRRIGFAVTDDEE